jgi:hypothetical protein
MRDQRRRAATNPVSTGTPRGDLDVDQRFDGLIGPEPAPGSCFRSCSTESGRLTNSTGPCTEDGRSRENEDGELGR